MNKPPIFIGGAGRSGTTLMRVMLDSHPNIVCGPEFKIIPGIAEHWQKTRSSLGDVLTSYGLGLERFNCAYQHFIEELLTPMLEKSGKQRIAEKSPNNVFFFYHLHQIFPASPMVHLIRDGRDVVCSLLTMDWLDPKTGKKMAYVQNAEYASLYWVRAVQAGRKAGELESLRNNYIEVKYEELVLKSEKTLRGLLSFLGETWDSAVLKFYQKDRDLGIESSADQVTHSIVSSSIGRWQRDLSAEDKRTVKEVAGDLLIALNYAKDKEW